MARWILVSTGFALVVGCARPAPEPSPPPPPGTGVLGPAERFPVVAGPEGCADVPAYTLDELATGAGAGKVIAVEGVPRASVICTALYCGRSECCNKCGGGYMLRDGPRHRVYLLNLGGCTGRECDLDCRPFGREPTRAYRFVGRHRYSPAEPTRPHVQSFIDVERYCRAKRRSGRGAARLL